MAAVKELLIEEKLKALYSVQQIDSKIAQIQVLKGELPMEVADLEDEVAGLDTRVKNIQAEIKALEEDVANLAIAKKESVTLIKKYEKQQNNVKNNREFDALTKEVDMQNLEIQLAEKKTKKTHDDIDSKKAYLKESKALTKEKKQQLADKKVELEKIIKETDKEEKSLNKKLKEAKGKIEDSLMISYEKIKHAYSNGLAVVPVERDSCGGCFNKVPPQMKAEIKQRKKIKVCEHCGRILVDDEMGDE